MSQPIGVAALLLVLSSTSACVSTTRLAEPPQALPVAATLESVNEQLSGRLATIILKSGRRISRVEDVSVQPDTSSYTAAYGVKRRRSLPTSEIQQVRIRTGSGEKDGFLIGMAPGIALAAFGAATANGSAGFISEADVRLLALCVGGAVALVGGVVGAGLGYRYGNRETTVFKAPVSEYLMAQ